MQLNLPLGIEYFRELIEYGCYYVDKTGFIKELLEDTFKVNLITRPRRFGKTLTISMLAEFFDIRKDSQKIFDGLMIAKENKLCMEWRNQWPVLFFSLKDVSGTCFEEAYGLLQFLISSLCMEHTYLEQSDSVHPMDKKVFHRLLYQESSFTDVQSALFVLMRMMAAHYKKEVILLIDEYDVPLAKASDYGYYEEMLNLIRSFLGMTWKTNPCLKFAVITGCLRIAKESIFTGANNFISRSISERWYHQYFGFTTQEVEQLLKKAELFDHFLELKKWYDGYLFGGEEIYCPWDVINHVSAVIKDPDRKPSSYWKDTSHNAIIRKFIDKPEIDVKDKFEILLAGGTIEETIQEDLTYDMVNSTEENLWSILYLTGYLTQASCRLASSSSLSGSIPLKIPNEEIKMIFAETVATWFQDMVGQMDRRELFAAWWNGADQTLTELVTDILFETISYYDYREDYYHAFLAGLFTTVGYQVSSNKEYGTGRADIVVKDRKHHRALIIEVKRSRTKETMRKDCEKAIRQIEQERYMQSNLKGYRIVLCYGAAFFEKECLIQLQK